MTLWLVFTLMIAAAAVLVSTPFMVRRMERVRLQSAGNLCRLSRSLRRSRAKVAQGGIDNAQAEGAILEIKRKILASGRTEDPAGLPLGQAERKFALIVVTLS